MKTTGDLRAFLAETIERVRNGTCDHASADRIAKLAGQISASMTAEAQAALVCQKFGGSLGALPLGGVTEATAEPTPVIASVKASVIAPAARVATKPEDRERVWCEQCDRSVTVGEAVSCKSAFCKAKAAA